MNRIKILESHLVISTGFVVIFLFQLYKGTDPNPIFLYIAGAVGIIGVFIPALAKHVNWLWYKIADVMGFVMSKVLLSAVFFIFLTPVALLSRIVNKDKLGLRPKKDTYWKSRSHTFSSDDLENPW